MNTPSPKIRIVLLCAILGAGALTTSCATSGAPVKEVSTPPLLDTQWRLTQLGGEVVDNSVGDRAVNFQLQSSSTNIVGFSGCNRMFGRYALDGASLKFDGMGGTRMFCQSKMDLEQKYLAMFQNVAGWKMTDGTLQLLDANATALATFTTP